jgi:hypothetical protein
MCTTAGSCRPAMPTRCDLYSQNRVRFALACQQQQQALKIYHCLPVQCVQGSGLLPSPSRYCLCRPLPGAMVVFACTCRNYSRQLRRPAHCWQKAQQQHHCNGTSSWHCPQMHNPASSALPGGSAHRHLTTSSCNSRSGSSSSRASQRSRCRPCLCPTLPPSERMLASRPSTCSNGSRQQQQAQW